MTDELRQAAIKGAFLVITPENSAEFVTRLEAAERDAARYRWLRDGEPYADDVCPDIWCVQYQSEGEPVGMEGSELDAAIDSAMQKEPTP